MKKTKVETPLGTALIEGDENGICKISIQEALASKVIVNKIPKELQECVNQLQEYFKGEREKFNFPLQLKGTEFQQKVWRSLLEIPYGKTASYLQLSKNMGNTKAIRAVASANRKNPLWIVVPCHRVIGSDGSLTGYAGGLWRKKWLLDHESPYHQQKLF